MVIWQCVNLILLIFRSHSLTLWLFHTGFVSVSVLIYYFLYLSLSLLFFLVFFSFSYTWLVAWSPASSHYSHHPTPIFHLNAYLWGEICRNCVCVYVRTRKTHSTKIASNSWKIEVKLKHFHFSFSFRCFAFLFFLNFPFSLIFFVRSFIHSLFLIIINILVEYLPFYWLNG